MGDLASAAADFAAPLFSGGAADAGAGAADAGTGIADLAANAGAGAANAVGAGGADLASLVGRGEGLFGGTTGLEGTLLSSGATGGIADIAGSGGPTALNTASDFMAAPSASLFNPEVAGGVSAFSSGDSRLPLNSTPTSGTGTLGTSGASGTTTPSIFDTATPTNALSALNPQGATGAIPSGGGASAISAPVGVNAPVDATAAAGSATAATTGATPSTSISDLLNPSKVADSAISSLVKNPLPVALGAGGLAYNIFNGQKQTANQNALAADAKAATANSNQMVASGEDLQKYLTNGTLPPNYQSQVDQAISDAKATAISNAAGQGLSTDPTQNTALAAQLAKIDASKAGMQSQVAAQLFSSGSSLVSAGQGAAGLSGQLYQALVANDTAAAKNTGAAIATLAAALNGKSNNTVGGTNIQVSQT